jgi:hypothetical protein
LDGIACHERLIPRDEPVAPLHRRLTTNIYACLQRTQQSGR